MAGSPLRASLLSLLFTFWATSGIAAEAIRPSDDDLFLGNAMPVLSRPEPSPRPGDIAAAITTARRAIEYGRANGDPRAYGEAEAALEPWWTMDDPPEDVRLLRGIIKQANHDFAAAALDFDAVLQASPQHLQARLSRAFLRMVMGNPMAAAEDCAALSRKTSTLIQSICMARAAGLSGKVKEGIALLSEELTRADVGDTSMQRFAAAVLADLYIANGQSAAAEALYRTAMTQSEVEIQQVAAYADLLLDLGRDRDVLHLLNGRAEHDALRLRRAIAAKRLADPSFRGTADALSESFVAAAVAGNRVHLREETRFQLAVVGDPDAALTLALANFSVQKEPADIALVLEAALASGKPDSAAGAVAFVHSTGLADARLDASLQRIAAK